MKKKILFLTFVLLIPFFMFHSPCARAQGWGMISCVRAVPRWPGDWSPRHLVPEGEPAVLKAVVRDYYGPLYYEWDFGDGTTSGKIEVTDPYVIEIEHLYQDAIPASVFDARVILYDYDSVNGVYYPIGEDMYPIEIVWYDTMSMEARSMAIEKALWWAHKQMDRYVSYYGNPVATFHEIEEGWPVEMIEAATTIIIAQGFVDLGYKVTGDINDPYVDDLVRMVNYVAERLDATPIGIKPADGVPDPDYPPLDPEGGRDPMMDPTVDGMGIYFMGYDLEYEMGAALRLLATCVDPYYGNGPGMVPYIPSPQVSGWSHVQILQQMVDFLAWTQLYKYANDYGDVWPPGSPRPIAKNLNEIVPEDGRGSWPYWNEGWSWDPSQGRGRMGDVSIGYWAVGGLREAEKAGAVIPDFVRDELRRFLSYNQDLQPIDPATGMPNPYYGELYFGPARAHHLVERAGEGLFMFQWLGMNAWDEEVSAAAGFIDRFWDRNNYRHWKSWPWDSYSWERGSNPCDGDDCFSHFGIGQLYEAGFWEEDGMGGYVWVSKGYVDEMNIFGFLTITKGVQAFGGSNFFGGGQAFWNLQAYEPVYVELMCRNQLEDGSWDDSAWIKSFKHGEGWGLMLLARLMADVDGDGWWSFDDCDDLRPDINFAAPEILYNHIDENCNGMADDDDLDLDGYPLAEDCDDFDPMRNPGMQEVCSDWIDNDCDDMIDGMDSDCVDVLTPAGTNVSVMPVDQSSGITPVEITFQEVTAEGTTSVFSSPTGPEPPAGFRLGESPIFYELTTTASFAGQIEVCFDYYEWTYDDEASLRLFHYESDWVDVTISQDTTMNIICGLVDSLSPFAIFEPSCIDADGDGYAGAGAGCGIIDCDDADGSVNPGAIEICDAVDNDCDGTVDEGFDQDGDGYTTCSGDCDDADSLVNPGAIEICDAVDNDCDTSTIDGSGEPAPLNTLQSGVCFGTARSCTGGLWVDNYGYITGYEVIEHACDGLDNDCDGTVDDVYIFNGFRQPINSNGSSIFKAGRTVPVKVIITGCSGMPVSTATVRLVIYRVSTDIQGTVEELLTESSGDSNEGSLFRYDEAEGQYIFNLSTRNYSSGTYRVVAELDNGEEYSVRISLK